MSKATFTANPIISRVKHLTLRGKMLLFTLSLATIVPIVMSGILGALYYRIGLETLFDKEINQLIGDTVNISERYINEHKASITHDMVLVSNFIETNRYYMLNNPQLFNELLDNFVKSINLSGAVVFTKNRVISLSKSNFSLLYNIISAEDYRTVDAGEISIKEVPGDRLRALVRIGSSYPEIYLMIESQLDGTIISHRKRLKGSQNYYNALRLGIYDLQYSLLVSFIIASAIIVLLASLVALKMAQLIISPIDKLANLTKSITHGDYSVRLPENEDKDEIMLLTKAFNQMASEIALQKERLLKANALIDERRKFIETVLAGISTGIIVIETSGKISLFNKSAKQFLQLENDKHYTDVLPEIEDLFKKQNDVIGARISIRRNLKIYDLLISITKEKRRSKISRHIIAFDDITDLVQAQKDSAWAEVARRIAHEIKNPLTPIQLASDRIANVYKKTAQRSSQEYSSNVCINISSIDKYLDIINNHVGQIRVIVEEFVEFSRLPAPHLQSQDIVSIIKESLFTAAKGIKFETHFPDSRVLVLCDKIQMSQVMNNLVKNASDSLDTNIEDPCIEVILEYKGSDKVTITVRDNGNGFDDAMLSKAINPYVTSKQSGMGLGLSIVRKIVEDHHGKLHLYNHPEKGACVSFVLMRVV